MTDFNHSPGLLPQMSLPEMDPRDQAMLALLGHDLRAALSDVIGGLRLIPTENLDLLTRLQIDRVRASSEGLARLLEQGLDTMLGNTGPLQQEDLNLQRFLTDLDLRWSGRAVRKGIGFAVQRKAGLPIRFRTDRVALDRVLSNLLDNAFKYGNLGGVVLGVSVTSDGYLGFSIRDDGPGFPVVLLDLQRARYGRPTGMTKPGNGMGLNIAADLTQRMGGRMTLRNLEPVGADARIELPLAEWETGTTETGPSGAKTLIGKRVLIADDNRTSRIILADIAASCGADVLLVNDGVAAVNRLECEAFDLLIVDVEMPKLSGLDVIRCLRSMPGAVAKIPVVAVTAHDIRSKRQSILAAGANEVLSKLSLSPEVVADVIRLVMANAAGPMNTTVRPPPIPIPLQMDDGLWRLLRRTPFDVGCELLDQLLVDLQEVERGLTFAGTETDWDGVRRHSHILISLAGTVGSVPLQAEAEALNQLAHLHDWERVRETLAGVLVLLFAAIQFVGRVQAQHQVPVT